jgi:malate synthase
LINEEEKKIKQQQGNQFEDGHFVKAKTLFENLVFSEHFHEFLTIPAYEFLD